MSKVEVIYTATFKQTIDWPDDELDDFNYDNLECNLDIDRSNLQDEDFDISDVKLNGQSHDF